jgi:hypothetical protein
MRQFSLSLPFFSLPLLGLVAILTLTGCVGKTMLSPPASPPAVTVPPPAPPPSLPPKPPERPEPPPAKPQPDTGGAPEKPGAYLPQDEQGGAAFSQPEKPSSSPYQPKLGPAASLYNQGEHHLQQGELDKAEMFLERALRIEPRNPDYWHTMAEIRFRQGKKQEAIQCCLKSNSLATGSRQLIKRNNALIARVQAEDGHNTTF